MTADETPFVPDPLLDEEVNEALIHNDPNIIWAMTATLAAMETEEWARHRSAIKRRFNGNLNIGLLDKAIKEHHEKETDVKSSPTPLLPWEKILHRNEKGDPKPVLINADLALRNYPEWEGVLAFDEFKQKIRAIKRPPIGGDFPRDWTDTDDTNATVWMQAKGIYVGRDVVSSAIQSVAFDNKMHVVQDYLKSLVWDGVPCIDNWLTTFLGVDDNKANRMIGSRWLISAIARIMNPGCQVDYMLVLEGPQGTKKSTALKTLASQEWFCDHTPDLHDKDSQMQLSGSWIVEWGELDALRKSEVTAVKSFLTRKVEKFRPPYGRYVVEIPRQCVFAGTTNETAWLKDDTGGRRFWPVTCGVIDIESLESNRDQLWAEAMTRYMDGSIWWPDTAEENTLLTTIQSARMEQDSWQDEIEKYLQPTLISPAIEEITIQQILQKCIGLPIAAQGHAEKLRVGRVMRSLGWEYIRERIPDNKGLWSGYRRAK